MEYILENDGIRIVIDSHGAELTSICDIKSGTERLWDADPEFWNRHSPVLFPFVGGVRNKEYRHKGKTYTIGQHGFARDLEHTPTECGKNSIFFSLSDNENTLSKYPFKFLLETGYILSGNEIKVIWKVTNTSDEDMYFAIGAHPGFMCPISADEKQEEYSFLLKDMNGRKIDSFIIRKFGEGGCVKNENATITCENGILPITEHLFDNDALVLENSQVGEVSLVNKAGEETLKVSFDAPLLGLWSPPKKHAPFVCIEPWYGRCDAEDFEGELKDREHERVLKPEEVFEAEYTITIM